MNNFFDKYRPETIAKIFIACILILLSVKIFIQSQNLTKFFSVSPSIQAEWSPINGGKGFAEQGFLSNGGLQDIRYGKVASNGKKAKKYVKITYPPAPHWLAGIYFKICGIGNEDCYRIFPSIFGIISLILIARILMSVLEPIKSALLMLSLAVIPATTNAMHLLTYVTYASPLFLIQIALLLKIFKGTPKEYKKYLSILFITGFIQGWLSLDYIFLVCFSAIPFALLYFQDTKEYRNRFLLVVLACSIGFLFAHLLHLIQVIIYKGGILETYKRLSFEIIKNFNGSSEPDAVRYDDTSTRLQILLDYIRYQSGRNVFFRITVTKFLIVTISFLLIQKANVTIQKPLQISLNWKSNLRNIFVILTAFIVSILWIVFMKQQASGHQAFFTNHLFLLYFISLLTILECVDFGNDNTELRKQ